MCFKRFRVEENLFFVVGSVQKPCRLMCKAHGEYSCNGSVTSGVGHTLALQGDARLKYSLAYLASR